MGSVVALDTLLQERRIWRGQQDLPPTTRQPTGHSGLDAVLPAGGWQAAAVNELLLPTLGSGAGRTAGDSLSCRLVNGRGHVVSVVDYSGHGKRCAVGG